MWHRCADMIPSRTRPARGSVRRMEYAWTPAEEKILEEICERDDPLPQEVRELHARAALAPGRDADPARTDSALVLREAQNWWAKRLVEARDPWCLQASSARYALRLLGALPPVAEPAVAEPASESVSEYLLSVRYDEAAAARRADGERCNLIAEIQNADHDLDHDEAAAAADAQIEALRRALTAPPCPGHDDRQAGNPFDGWTPFGDVVCRAAGMTGAWPLFVLACRRCGGRVVPADRGAS